jgi:hypothetical protein
MRIILICLILVLAGLSACSPPVTPPPVAEKSLNESREEIVDELRAFLADNYPDWHLEGSTIGVVDALHLDAVSRKRLFDVHLIKGKGSKVITLGLEDFYDKDGKLYWHIYEPKSLQIGNITVTEALEDAEERGKEKTKR